MFKKVSFLFFLLIVLVSCVETVVVGTVVGGAIILNDGSIFDLSQDSRIKSSIVKSLKEDNNDNYKHISVNVFNGRVMLTGYVNNSVYKVKAVNEARAIKEDVEVLDEIMVLNPNYKLSSTSDSFISNQISLKIKTSKKIKSSNYKYDVVDGNVFILGVAKDKKEFDEVCDIVRRIKGVNKVITYITFISKQQ